MAIATQIGPSDLLAAPPRVFNAIVQLLAEQAEEADREERMARLRDKFKDG